MQAQPDPPDQLALRLWGAIRRREWETVRSLVHPDADIQAGVSPGEPLDRELAVSAREIAVDAEAYDPKLRSFEALDDSTALVSGETYHRHPGDEIEERRTVWLYTFRDGLLIRSRVFGSIGAALDQHRADTAARTR
jgi:hypothetical protein